MVELLQVNQTKTLEDLVKQLNQVLRRISQLIGQPAGVAGTTTVGLTEAQVIALIRRFVSTVDDDLSNYAYLPGRVEGQVLNGGAASGEDLELRSNAGDRTTGEVIVGSPIRLFELDEDTDSVSGLTWAYFGGDVRQGPSVVTITGSTIGLAASTTNFVEVDANSGVVTANAIAFSYNKTPIRQVTTNAASVVTSVDKRTWITERKPVKGAFVWVVTSTVAAVSNASHLLRCMTTNGAVLERCVLDIKTAPTGQSIICDVLKNGTSVFSVKPQIVSSAVTGSSSSFSVATLAFDDLLQLNVDQVGSTATGSGLTASLEITQRR